MFYQMVCKMCGIGYLLNTYLDKSETKAIICMDGQESEVGASNGGTGKSLFGQIIQRIVSTVTIDGKKNKLADDQFMYEEVDERTQVIFIDDCRANLDFEFFFGQVTRGIVVNGKGVKRFSLPAPKFLFTTNHAMKGDGHSFNRRQYLLSFSDWYGPHRTPKDDFGCILFDEWDSNQWNLYYNFIACCIQTYLKFKLNYEIELEDLERRKLRQRIGENMLDWATSYFASDYMRNKKVNKKMMYQDFITEYPQDLKFCNQRKFKKRLKLFCEYSGFDFNPTATPSGSDIKSNGKEFFIIADDNFSSDNYDVIDG